MKRFALVCAVSSFLAFGLVGCGSDSDNDGTGGTNVGGGPSGTGGTNAGGGPSGTGGTNAGGGDTGTGGTNAGGGDTGTGGTNAGGGDTGTGGGGGEEPQICEKDCEKVMAANCSKNPESNDVCVSACKNSLEGLSANSTCASSYEAYLKCESDQTLTCDNEGYPVPPDGSCDTQSDAFGTCIEPYLNEPKCNDWCDKRIAANCSADEFKDKDKCVKLCQGFIFFSIVSKDCWPKWNAALTCMAKTEHLCNDENKPATNGCESEIDTYTKNCSLK